MCGIAGFLGQFDGALLGAMNDSIRHRGPDDAADYHDASQGIGLTHRRLSIIDLSAAGRQPMWEATGRVVVCYNGEIYNYLELRRELEAKGYRFHSQCDTEILPNLYLEEGPDFVRRLNGIFALALWDTEKRELLLARDGCGIKPLYYTTTPRGLLFASELKALLCAPDTDRTLDPEAIACYISYLYSPAPRTMLKAVHKLLPGHALIANRDGLVRTWQYYDIPCGTEDTPMTEAEAIEGVRHHLDTAVRRQMIADVPVGAFLSGGLDSSSIVAFARQHAKDRSIECFTIGFRDPQFAAGGEDLPHANRVAEHLGVSLRTIWVGPEISAFLEDMVYHLDEPQGDPAAINAYFISRMARENGIKVLLSGAGGDDIFTGYRRHRALGAERMWTTLPVGVRALLRQTSHLLPKRGNLGRRIAKAFAYADEPDDRRLAGYFLWAHPQVVGRLFSPALKEQLAQFDCMRPMLDALGGLPAAATPLAKMLYLDTKYFLTDHNLNYTDKMSMAVGVEVRVPFLDPDLMAFVAKIPLALRQRGAEGKWILKRAMERDLPHASIYRRKAGFGVPLEIWLRNELRPLVEDTLSAASLRRRGLFDPAAVAELLKSDREGGISTAYPILGLMCIEIWCRRFLNRQPPAMTGAQLLVAARPPAAQPALP